MNVMAPNSPFASSEVEKPVPGAAQGFSTALETNGVRQDWTRAEIAALYDLPFDELMFQAQTVHRAHHAAGQVQLCTLLSIKTGGCPEDCG